MKLAPAFRFVALLVFFLGGKSLAASYNMVVTNNASTITLGNTITYGVRITNPSGNDQATTLTAEFPNATEVVQVSNDVPQNFGQNVVATNRGSVVFQFDFPARATNNFLVRLRPASNGSFTTTFTVSSQVGRETNSVTTTVINGQADLQVGFDRMPTAVLVNDLVTYDLVVTNRGPNLASDVIVTNVAPQDSEFFFRSLPAETTVSSNQIVWRLGQLANATARTLTLTVKPSTVTNTAGFSANVQASFNSDPTAANDTVTNSISVSPIVTNTLSIVSRTAQRFNTKNALIEETVTVRNVGSATIPNIRLFVFGIVTSNRLYNASGTNLFPAGTTNIIPFMVSTTNSLPAGASTNILVQYFFPSRQFNPNIGILGVEGPSTGTNNVVITSTNAVFSTNLFTLTAPAIPGRRYSVTAADNVLFTNSTVVIGSVTATNDSIGIVDTLFDTNNAPLRPTRFFQVKERP